ncbi:hypothetical protein [Clostridium sp. UBA7791]|uniref:hypothetical protein n=1 Tax=Clostridium sp. UBA7791 TaxID=1946379 RepID=UPI003216A6AE
MKKNILVILTVATIIAFTGCGDKIGNNLDGEKKQAEEKVNFDCNPGVVLSCTPNKGDLTIKGQSCILLF